MEKVLLIIPDWTLRQLYHEHLFSKKTEVIGTNSIDEAIGFLAIKKFNAIILWAEDINQIAIFLKLRRQRPIWLTTKLILLTSHKHVYSNYLATQDIILDPLTTNHKLLVSKIRNSLDN